MRLNEETGIYVAISLPKNKSRNAESKQSKKTIKKEMEVACSESSDVFEKAQRCLAVEDIRIIEAKDKEILEKWMKSEDDSRYVSINFNEETGVYTATSTPKTDGQGKVLFRKID
jgi:uncharacterized protein (DUF2147 family)